MRVNATCADMLEWHWPMMTRWTHKPLYLTHKSVCISCVYMALAQLGQTALHRAVMMGRVKSVRALLDLKAIVAVADQVSHTHT